MSYNGLERKWICSYRHSAVIWRGGGLANSSYNFCSG